MRRLAAVLVGVLVAAGCRPLDDVPSPATTVASDYDRAGRVELASGMPWLTVDDRPKVPARDKTAAPSETYNRDRDWMPDGWTDPDGNGCDTREDTLIRESLTPLECRRGRVVGEGLWWRGYEPGQTTSARDLQIDHVVSLAAAWRSGGWRWPVEKMRAYAQAPEVLWAVDAAANQAKSDDGPDTWRPNNPLVRCMFAQRYWAVVAKYELTVTSAELAGLRDLLRAC